MKDSPVRLSIKLLLTSLFAMMTAIAAMQGVFALVALDAIDVGADNVVANALPTVVVLGRMQAQVAEMRVKQYRFIIAPTDDKRQEALQFIEKAKQNFAIATIGRKKSRWFLDKPTIFEAVELNEDARWLFDFFTGVEEMGRIMMVPPNMPKARLAYLQAAIKETLHNPQLIAEGERTERIIEYLDPESTLKNAQTIVSNVTPEQKKRVQTILARNK